MPPEFLRFGPPVEFLIVELAYFILVTGISTYIYLKTKEIYDLTKHRGIYHFRNIFLYFGFAYLFRLLQLVMMFSRQLFSFDVHPRELMPINFFLVTYFSTLAILSVIISSNIRNIKIKEQNLNLLLHLTSFVSSLLAIIFLTPFSLVLLQTITFLAAIIMILFSAKDRHSTHLSQNKVTYVLLFVFWIVNIFAFIRMRVPMEIKIPIYMISAGVFFSILFRVRKRLTNAEKKR